MLPVVDDELDESDALADVLAFTVDFALADDDGLFAGLDEDLVAAADTWPRVGAEPESCSSSSASAGRSSWPTRSNSGWRPCWRWKTSWGSSAPSRRAWRWE